MNVTRPPPTEPPIPDRRSLTLARVASRELKELLGPHFGVEADRPVGLGQHERALHEVAVRGQELEDIALEEMAREFVRMEIEHADEVRKMLRRPDAA